MIPARQTFCKIATFVCLALMLIAFVRFGGEFNRRRGLAKADVKPRVESWKDMFNDQLHPDHLDCRELFATQKPTKTSIRNRSLNIAVSLTKKPARNTQKQSPKLVTRDL